LIRRIRERGFNPGNFGLCVEGNWKELFLGGPKPRLFMPNSSEFDASIFNERFSKFLNEIESSHQKATYSPQPTKSDPFVDDGTQENFTVAQIASMWQLSTDTIQRMFQDEVGVLPLGNKNPRGKRRRITLRIPREVMERVKKRRSNA
jgi:hypothetical protein